MIGSGTPERITHHSGSGKAVFPIYRVFIFAPPGAFPQSGPAEPYARESAVRAGYNHVQ